MAAGDIVYASDLGQDQTSWVPALSASTTPPGLGTGGDFIQSGLRWRTGQKMIDAWGLLRFGSSGPSAGSGTYIIGLPQTPATALPKAGAIGVGSVIGTAILRDNSAVSASLAAAVQIWTPTQAFIVLGTGNSVSNTVPWTWAASDSISFHLRYPTD